jgi:hypothetical protein
MMVLGGAAALRPLGAWAELSHRNEGLTPGLVLRSQK